MALGEFTSYVSALASALGCGQDRGEERALRLLSSAWGTNRVAGTHDTTHILSQMADVLTGEKRLRFEVLRRHLILDPYRDILSILLRLHGSNRAPPVIGLAPLTVPTPHRQLVSDHTFFGVEEKDLLRDLIFALQGVDGHWIYYIGGSYVVDPELCIARPARRICEEILLLATMHRKVCSFLEEDARGMIRQGLRDAIQMELVEYYREIATLEIRADSLTLRRLMVWIFDPFALLRTLWDVVSNTTGLEGASLISSVYTLETLQQGDVTKRVLAKVMAPFMRMIDLWMNEGLLKDVHSEFFVECDVSIPLEELWTKRYRLDESKVPCHIDIHVANKIFSCGKSLNFIRLCCQETDWLDLDIVSTRLATDEAATFGLALDRVHSTAQRTNERLVNLLFSKYHLLAHLLSIRRYLLLGQGDFISQLLTDAEEDLEQDANHVYKHTLLSHVDRAIRSTNAQFHKEDYLDRLDVKLLTPSSGENGWDIFILDYIISAPLHVVFSSDVMDTYHRAFSFLWQMRRVLHSLGKSWTSQMHHDHQNVEYQRKHDLRDGTSNLLHTCEILRHEMLHYVTTLHSYVMFEILEMAWQRLEQGLQECTDLDEVLKIHRYYMDAVSVGCFLTLSQEAILQRVRDLFDIVHIFTYTYDDLTACLHEEITALNDGKDSTVFRPPPRRQTIDFRSSIDDVSAQFTSGLRALCAQLKSAQQTQSESFLVEKLNFNEFYKSCM